MNYQSRTTIKAIDESTFHILPETVTKNILQKSQQTQSICLQHIKCIHIIVKVFTKIKQFIFNHWLATLLCIIFLVGLIIFIFTPYKLVAIVVAVGPEQKSLEMLKNIEPKYGNPIQKLVVGISKNMTILQQYLNSNKIKYYISDKYPYEVSFIDSMLPIRSTAYYYLLTTSEWSFQNKKWIFNGLQILNKKQNSQKSISIYPWTPSIQEYGLTKLGLIPGIQKATFNLQYQGDKSELTYPLFFSAVVPPETILNIYSCISVQNYYKSKGLQNIIIKQANISRAQQQHYFYKNNPIKIKDYLKNIQRSLKQAPRIYQVSLLKKFNELPFCLITIPSEKNKWEKLLLSIKDQKYENYKIIPILDISLFDYYDLRNMFLQKCQKNSLIMFVKTPLKQNSLTYLNKIHQSYKAWITYIETQKNYEIITFIWRIYQLLDKNDFQKTNKPFLLNNTISIYTLSMLQLCIDFNKMIDKQQVYVIKQDLSYFYVQKDNSSSYERHPYIGIQRLSQDLIADTSQRKKCQIQSKSMKTNWWTQLTKQTMMKSIDRQDQWYLSQNNTIQQLQFLEYDQKYNIGKYQSKQSQVRFCLTILNHNNIQNDRYIKVIKSIVYQKYENYHIVFIDDKSSDDSIKAAISYFKQIGFPQNKLTFVQNKFRSFATYNILNAAFNYCHQNDIQVLIDGDDEFIGKHALQVINSAYQQNPNLWIVYSNCKTNYYQAGWSVKILSNSYLRAGNKRMHVSSIGPIRSWRVKVIRSIPITHHKTLYGYWLDVMYDDAFQHPLAQLSSIQRIQYIPQILYQYNKNYGDNDDSTQNKKRHRRITYDQVASLTPLKPLNSLNETKDDQNVKQQLAKGNGIRYQKVQI